MKQIISALLLVLMSVSFANADNRPTKFENCKNISDTEKYYCFNPKTFQPNNVPNSNYLTVKGAYSQNNAIIMAVLSNIIYEDETTIHTIFNYVNKTYGTNVDFEFYDDTDESTEYMLINLNGHLVICFRGTQENRDYMYDGITGFPDNNYVPELRKAELLVPRSNKYSMMVDEDEDFYKLNWEKYKVPSGQRGFHYLTCKLIENLFFKKIDEFVKKRNLNISDSSIFLTGHSLGAALCQFILRPLVDYYGKATIGGVYLFAPPLALSCDDACYLQDTFKVGGSIKLGYFIHNIINETDIVTHGQNRGLTAHPGFFYRNTVGAASVGTLHYSDEEYIYDFKLFRTKVASFINNHPIVNYIDLARTTSNSSKNVNTYQSYPNHVRGKTSYCLDCCLCIEQIPFAPHPLTRDPVK